MKLLTKLVAATAASLLWMPTMSVLAGTTTGADIQVSGSSNLGSPVQGQPYTYTFQVKNSGPQDAYPVTFTDDLTAGTLRSATVDFFPALCSSAPDGNGGTAITCTMSIAKGSQSNVYLNVTAPTTIGSFSNTGTATSALADPQLSNNSFTVTVKVGSAACPLPAGQPTTTGVVLGQAYSTNGVISGFTMAGTDGVTYMVLMNFFDATQPLTSTINLLCKVVPPNLYIQPTTTDNVTGPVDVEIPPGMTVAMPVIHALVVQTPYWIDKVA